MALPCDRVGHDLLTLAGVAAAPQPGRAAVLGRCGGRKTRRTRFLPTYLSSSAGPFDADFQQFPPSQRLPVQYALSYAIGGSFAGQEDPQAAGGLAAVDCDGRRRGKLRWADLSEGWPAHLGEFFYHDPRRCIAAAVKPCC